MPAPRGNFDDAILQALLQQSQGGEQPIPVGAADTYSYGNGMSPRAGMVTDQYAPVVDADMQQAALLKKALKQMRSGK